MNTNTSPLLPRGGGFKYDMKLLPSSQERKCFAYSYTIIMASFLSIYEGFYLNWDKLGRWLNHHTK